MKENTLEVLCATMNQRDFSKYTEMNLHSAAVFANQTDYNQIQNAYISGYHVKMISTDTRGVGKNRNIALLHASGDILLFADEDIRYNDDYNEQVIDAYRKQPDADMIIFSMDITQNGEVIRKIQNKNKRLKIYNALKYGTYVVSIRRESWEKANIWFSLCYGGGTQHAHGEDTIFLTDAFRKKLKIYSSSYCLGQCAKDSSTCFFGYDEKFFFDQGYLYANIFGVLAKPIAVRFCVRKRHKYQNSISMKAAIGAFVKGIDFGRKERNHE